MILHRARAGERVWRHARTAALVALAVACAVAATPRAEAATAFWYGVSGSNWSTATNWNSVSSGTGSYTPVNGDSLRWFQSSTNSRISNNDIAGLSVAGISFQSTTGTYTLSGNKLTLTGGVTSVPAALVTINMPLELNASAVSFQGGADALKLNGVLSETGGSRQLQVSTGTVTLGADNSFSNGIMVGISAVAAVRVASIANIGVNQPLGSGTLVILGQSDGNGTLIYSGTGDVSTNKRLQVGRLDSGTAGTAIVRNDGSGVITWNGAQNPSNNFASNRMFVLGGTNAGANTWAAAIVNNGSNGIVNFTKQDAGRWILSAANTYSGTTTVSGGVLGIANNLALQNSPLDTSGAGTVTLTVTTPTLGGLVGATDLASVITTGYGSVTNLTLNPGAGQSSTYSGALADGAAGMTLTKTGSGTQILAGLNSYTGSTTVSAGTLDLGVTGSFAGPIANAASLVLTQVGAGTAHVGGLISGPGTVTVGSTGAVRLANAGNTYTGDTVVAGGVLVADALAAAGAASPLGGGTFVHLGSGTLPGTLRFIGSSSGSTNRPIRLSSSTGGGTIEANGSVPLVLSGSIGAADGTKTLTLTGTSAQANAIGAITAPTTGTLDVVKDGTGLWRLTGTSDFSGPFTVRNGTVVAVANASEAGSSGVFGRNGPPIVGDTAAGASGTAALLAENGATVRGVSVSVSGTGSTQVVLVGGANTSGTVTYAGNTNLNLGRDVALVATTGGVVNFANNWRDGAGVGTPTTNVDFGADGFAGTVRLTPSATLATTGGIAVRHGTATLDLNTILDGAGTLSIDAPATLGGIGTVAGPLGGAGLVAPGNSPGILTAEALDPSGGLDFSFEFLGATPTYTSSGSSVNDILRLTGTSPFLGGALDADNIVRLYLPASAAAGGTFTGGFFTDMTSGSFSTFLTAVSSGSFVAYYENSGGAFPYGGRDYSLLADLGKSVQVGTITVSGTTNFQTGAPAVDGQLTTFTVAVPEPAALALAGIGIATGVAWTLRRRAAAGRPDRARGRRPADG